jgi:hypothetical protein
MRGEPSEAGAQRRVGRRSDHTWTLTRGRSSDKPHPACSRRASPPTRTPAHAR